MRLRGISPVIATAVLVAVVLAIALAFAFWGEGIVGIFTSQVEVVKVKGDLKVYGIQFEIYLVNDGTVDTKVRYMFLSGRRAYVFEAVDSATGEPRIVVEDGEKLIELPHRSVVRVRGFVLELLRPGTMYEVKLVTVLGKEFMYPVLSTHAPLEAGLVAYNTGIKDPSDPGKRIVVFAPVMENRLRAPMLIKAVALYSGNITDPSNRIFEKVWSPPIRVPPEDVWRPSSWRDLLKASLEPGTYYAMVNFSVGGRDDYLLTLVNVDNRTLKVYIVYLTEDDEDPSDVIEEPYPGWSVDIRRMEERISRLAEVRRVSKFSTYKSIVEGTYQLEEPCVLINIHSEPVPLPKEYVDENGKRVYWHLWFRKIGSFIASHRVIWVNPSGYPFWGIANKRAARSYGYPTWTSNWGRIINKRSLGQAYRDTGGATNLVGTTFRSAYNYSLGQASCRSWPAGGVTYNGFLVVSGGRGTRCAETWREPIEGTELVEEFNEFFAEFGISLPTSTQGWDVPFVEEPEKIYYKTTGGAPHPHVPIIYGLDMGKGYLLVIGLPPGATDLSTDMALYLSVHIIIFDYEIPTYVLSGP